MKKIAITLLLITVMLSIAACKATPKAGTSSEVQTKSEISSIVLSEGDFFNHNGTESEAELTDSEVEELFKNQESRDQEDSSSKTESQENTESDDTQSTDSKETQSDNSTSNGTESKEESSKTAESASKYDKDGDGWTDDWK